MISKDIYSNINISDEMKESLIKDVKKGKRTADLRFRYSTALMALGIVGVLGFGGIGASAAYLSYKERVQSMSVEEKQDYKEELEADTYNTMSEGMTRSLTSEEWDRYLVLEDEYYKNGRFPAESFKYVEKQSDVSDSEIAFVEEINKIHIPEGELTDEQILQLIDHEAKYIYTMEQNASEEGYLETTEENASDTKIEVSEASEQELKQKAIDLIKDYYNDDIDDSWNYLFDPFKPSEAQDGEEIDTRWDCYSIVFTESDAPNATMYQISIPMEEDGVFAINCCGKKYYMGTTAYTREDAEQFVEKGQKAVIDFVKEKYGLGDPDKVEINGFENLEGTPIDSEDIDYQLYYGENSVSVSWNITNEMVYSVMGSNLNY